MHTYARFNRRCNIFLPLVGQGARGGQIKVGGEGALQGARVGWEDQGGRPRVGEGGRGAGKVGQSAEVWEGKKVGRGA